MASRGLKCRLFSQVNAKDEIKALVKFACVPAPNSLFCVTNCVPGFEQAPWLACQKAIVRLANQVERKFVEFVKGPEPVAEPNYSERVCRDTCNHLDAFYFTENSSKIKRKYHRKKGGPTAKSGKENKDLGAASQLLVSGHGSYIIFWEKIKEFSRTKILFSRLLFPNNIKQRPLECVDGGGFAYCNTCLH